MIGRLRKHRVILNIRSINSKDKIRREYDAKIKRWVLVSVNIRRLSEEYEKKLAKERDTKEVELSKELRRIEATEKK